jgi:cytochrome c-type biogenesis protein CcmF
MFVVYSTFLTRSGILGDISVHSFVDLGLYNQLLLWILTMGVLGFGLFASATASSPRRRRRRPRSAARG